MNNEFDEVEYEHIRELIFVHEHVNALENVYYRGRGNSYISPEYALEKLETAKAVLEIEIKYWEGRKSEETK